MNLFQRMLNSNEPWFIMVIELSGVQFELKSQVWFQTKIARHKVQLPLYYIHFEIAQIQDLVSSNI